MNEQLDHYFSIWSENSPYTQFIYPQKKKKTLFDFQEKAFTTVKEMLEKENVILNLDTGLGKTFIAYKLIEYYLAKRKEKKYPVLLVARASNLNDPWMQEFSGNNGNLKVYKYSGSHKDDVLNPLTKLLDLDRFDVIITSYNILGRSQNLNPYFLKTEFLFIIYDEIHTVINGKKATKTLKNLEFIKGNKRLALTASPISNSIEELFVLNKFMVGESIEEIYKKIHTRSDEIKKVVNIENMYTKMKVDVQDQIKLPRRIQVSLLLPISDSMKLKLSEIKANNYSMATRLLSIPSKFIENDGDIRFAAKEKALNILLKTIPDKSKIIVYSMFSEIIRYYSYLNHDLYSCYLLDGSNSQKERERKIKTFNECPQKCILFTTLKASGTGLNLQKANYVIFLDQWFNPQTIKQAKDRIYRLNQTKETFVFYLGTATFFEGIIGQEMDKKERIASLYLGKEMEVIYDEFYDLIDSVDYLLELQRIFELVINTGIIPDKEEVKEKVKEEVALDF